MSGTGKAEGHIGEKDMRKRRDEERSILCVMEGQRSARSLLGESERRYRRHCHTHHHQSTNRGTLAMDHVGRPNRNCANVWFSSLMDVRVMGPLTAWLDRGWL